MCHHIYTTKRSSHDPSESLYGLRRLCRIAVRFNAPLSSQKDVLGGYKYGQRSTQSPKSPTPTSVLTPLRFPSTPCPTTVAYRPAATPLRRKLYSLELPTVLEQEGKDRSWDTSPHPSPMLGHSNRSSEVGTPFHLSFSLTYPTPPPLTEFQGYSDITVMTDEEGVEERYQPTKSNLVRNLPQPPTSINLNNLF